MKLRESWMVYSLAIALAVAGTLQGCSSKSGQGSSSQSSTMSGSSTTGAGSSSSSGTAAPSGSAGSASAPAGGVTSGSSSGTKGASASGGSSASTTHAEPAGSRRLPGSHWDIAEIGGQAVSTVSHPTLSFNAQNHVSGNTGCNDFNGNASLSGKTLHFSPMIATRKSCEPELMSQESRLLKALDAVRGYSFDAEGALHLTGADGTDVMKLTRASS